MFQPHPILGFGLSLGVAVSGGSLSGRRALRGAQTGQRAVPGRMLQPRLSPSYMSMPPTSGTSSGELMRARAGKAFLIAGLLHASLPHEGMSASFGIHCGHVGLG